MAERSGHLELIYAAALLVVVVIVFCLAKPLLTPPRRNPRIEQ